MLQCSETSLKLAACWGISSDMQEKLPESNPRYRFLQMPFASNEIFNTTTTFVKILCSLVWNKGLERSPSGHKLRASRNI